MGESISFISLVNFCQRKGPGISYCQVKRNQTGTLRCFLKTTNSSLLWQVVCILNTELDVNGISACLHFPLQIKLSLKVIANSLIYMQLVLDLSYLKQMCVSWNVFISFDVFYLWNGQHYIYRAFLHVCSTYPWYKPK